MSASIKTPLAIGRSWSLRRTLLAILLALTMSVWAFSAGVVYLEADQESHELFDQSLAETAHLLLVLADHEVEERIATSEPAAAAPSDAPGQYLLFQIWDNRKRLVYKNAGAPDAPLSAWDASGFGSAIIDGKPMRTYATWDAAHRLQIQVGEPVSHRREISSRFAWKLLLLMAVIIPVVAGGIWWAVNRVFRTLQLSTDEVSQRTASDLEDISIKDAPSEMRPLLQAINRLFERVRRTLEHEQCFTADAAHELRTPLAAIKTNLQVIQRARNDAERNEFIGGLGVSVDRATRLVEQLMTLARLDPQYEKMTIQASHDVSALVAAQLPYWQGEAEKLMLQLNVALEPAHCPVDPDSFLILLRNLMDNACRYTPAGGTVSLSCRVEQSQVCLRIADSGAGIPVEARERVFDRFFRLSDATKPGSGLGLSIVKKIVDAHQARIVLGSGVAGHGLEVTVWL